jgi:hypothetical protein
MEAKNERKPVTNSAGFFLYKAKQEVVPAINNHLVVDIDQVID